MSANTDAWKLFLLLPRLLLHSTRRGGDAGARDLRRRISLFDAGQWDQLLEESHRATPQRGSREANEETVKLAKALHLIEQGELSHAARALHSPGLAPGNDTTLDELRDPALRPDQPSEDLPAAAFEPQGPHTITLDKNIFGEVLRQARKGKSAGLAGNRNEYLRLCLEEDSSFDLLYSVADILAAAEVPEEVVRALAVSKLTAMLKPNGRIRGISSGDVFRRLVAKTLARQKQQVFRDLVSPANFGLSDRSGTDSLVHLVQFLLEEDTDRVLLSIDGVGAFDHVCRARFFEELLAHSELRDILPFVRQWYGGASKFSWHDDEGVAHEISQGDGGEQGDALMPALFCLALRRALQEIQGILPRDAYVFAYLDDVYVICGRDDVHGCYETVRDILQLRCHIDVNVGKLAVWGMGRAEAPPRVEEMGETVWKGSLPVNLQGIKVVGTPVGSDEFVQEHCREVLNNEAQLLSMIPKLASLQASWLILYFCAVPKINHLLRTLAPSQSRHVARSHDQAILEVFGGLFGIPSQDDFDETLHRVRHEAVMQQSTLPLRLGGCGLRDSERTSSAAYWASWADAVWVLRCRFPHVSGRMLGLLENGGGAPINALHEAELAGQTCEAAGWTQRPNWRALSNGLRPPQPEQGDVSLGEWAHGWQYHASSTLEQCAYASLVRTLAMPSRRRNARSLGKARLISCQGPFAAAWLTAYPGSAAMTFLDIELQCAMRSRLGLTVCLNGPDPHGHRRCADNLGARINARHTAMIAAWRQVLVEAGGQIPDRNVERVLARTHVPVPPGDLRRLDLVVPGLNVARGLPLFCDVTVLSPVARNGTPRPGTSNRAGALLEDAERENNSTYAPVIASGLGALFCLGCEVYGRWGKQCADLLPLLAREKSRGFHPRLRRGIALGYLNRWSGLLAVALQKAVSVARLRDEGADLPTTLLEEAPGVADLPAS